MKRNRGRKENGMLGIGSPPLPVWESLRATSCVSNIFCNSNFKTSGKQRKSMLHFISLYMTYLSLSFPILWVLAFYKFLTALTSTTKATRERLQTDLHNIGVFHIPVSKEVPSNRHEGWWSKESRFTPEQSRRSKRQG